MKKLTIILFTLISFYGQGQDMLIAGIHAFSPIGGPIINNMGFGLGFGAATQKKETYYLGMKVDLWLDFDQRPIDIQNNLQSNESIKSEMKFVSVTMLNRFDLTPDSKAKIFFDANIGFRVGKYDIKHDGNFIGLKTEDVVYDKTSGGIEAQLLINFFVPIRKDSKRGLQLKAGFVAGSPIHYVETGSVNYSNTGIVHGEEKSSSSFWIIGIDYIINLNH